MILRIYNKIFNKISVEEYCGYIENYPFKLHPRKNMYKNNSYEYYKLFYTYKNIKYCAVSKFPIDLNSINAQNINNLILYSYVQKKNKTVNVTDIIYMLSGPESNFHNMSIDFNWIFPDYDKITIFFTDSILCINILTNRVIQGENKHINLLK